MRYYAKKRLGQHFITDFNICRRIARAVNLTSNQRVLEIGPGRGSLTRILLEMAERVVAVEVDQELAEWLSEEFSAEREKGHFKVVVEDILKLDLQTLLQQEQAEDRIRVFGNLPYNIATAVIQHLITFRSHIKDMTLMLQREVANRIMSPPGSKQYGYLSIVVQYHCEGRKLFHLPPGVFRPSPKVTSTAVHLQFRESPPVEVKNELLLFQLASVLFTERRKTVLNNLKRAAEQFHLDNVEQRLRAAGINPGCRAETLGLEEFAQLANQLSE